MSYKTKKIYLKLSSFALAVTLIFSLPIGINAIAAADVSEITQQDSTNTEVISSTLRTMEQIAPQETYRVMIWLNDIDTTKTVDAAMQQFENYKARDAYLSKATNLTLQEAKEFNMYISAERAAMKSCYEPYTAKYAASQLSNKEIVYCSKYLPLIIADVSYQKIQKLASSGATKIDYYCDDLEEEPNIASPASVPLEGDIYYTMNENSNYIGLSAFENTWGTTGSGVIIGMLDYGIPNKSLPYFYGRNINVRYLDTATIEDHPTKVLEIMTSIAPGATYYCTSHWKTNLPTAPTLVEEIEWLLDNSVNVINISLRVDPYGQTDEGADAQNTYGSVSQYLDSIVYYYYVTIIKSAGNEADDGGGVTSGGMGYNVITVGNYNRGAASMSPSSSYYTGNGLCYKPDISAPGYYYFSTLDQCSYGTSYSAPCVTGVVALLMATGNSYRTSPNRVKATLTAAVNIAYQHYRPIDINYRQFGAGILNAANISSLAWEGNYEDSRLSTSAEHTYTTTFEAGSVVRIALAFEKCPTYNLANFDLQICNSAGTSVATISNTQYNNVEIVEFTPSATGTYTIKIINTASATNGTSIIASEYSIAWFQ